MSAAPASITSTDPDRIDGSRLVSSLPNLPAQLIRLQAANARLEATLAKVFEEVREFPDQAPESSESYLPPALVVEIAEVLQQAPDAHALERVLEPIVIYGPQGCGKTRHAAALAKHFGRNRVIDDWTGMSPLPAGTLALTSICPPGATLYVAFKAGRYKAYPFDRVMVALDGFLESDADSDRRPA